MSWEEQIVAYLASEEGCKSVALCDSPAVQAAQFVADWHLLSFLVIGFFLAMLGGLTVLAINFGK